MQRGPEHVKNRKEHGPFGAVGEMMLDAGCWILDFGCWILDFRPPGWRSQKRVILEVPFFAVLGVSHER